MKDDMNEKGFDCNPILEYYLKGCSRNVFAHRSMSIFFVLKTYAHISLTPPKRFFGGKCLVFCGRKFEEKIREKHVFSAK